MRLFLVLTILAFTSAAQADLNTATFVSIDGGGSGKVEGDITGVGLVTLLDEPGVGDMWNDGDQFQYLHDENRVTGSFTATVRVVSQTEPIEGRWGKGGIHASFSLEGDASYAKAEVATGTGSQVDPPETGDHNPVPVRLSGRTVNGEIDGNFDNFHIQTPDGTDIPNNIFATDGPNPAWLRLVYDSEEESFVACYADDNGGTAGVFNCSEPNFDIDVPDDGWYVGLAYSAHNQQGSVTRADGLHGISFEKYSIVAGIPLNDDTGDCNGDGVADAADLVCSNAAGTTDGLLSLLGLVPGDLDRDGTVAFADFLVLSGNFGKDVESYTEGDIDSSGDVAFADFLVLSANFGKTSGVAAAAVPEPAGLALLGLGSLLIGLVRRRR